MRKSEKLDMALLIIGVLFIIGLVVCITVLSSNGIKTTKEQTIQTKIFCANDIRELENSVNKWLVENNVEIVDFDYYYFETSTLAHMDYYCCVAYKK